MRINVVIILDVITMVGGRDEQRVEINHVNPQFLQIIHLIQHALQISAIEITHIHLRRIAVPILHAHGLIPDISIFPGKHIIGRIPIAEAIHHDLVHHRTLGPIRRGKSGNDRQIIMLFRLLHHSPDIIITSGLSGLNLKIISDLLIIQLMSMFIIVKKRIRRDLKHQILLSIAHKKDPIQIILLGAEPYCHFTVWRRFCR